MHRTALKTAAAIGVAGALLAGVSTGARAQQVDFINITTATTGGSYYPAGLAIADVIQQELDIRASAISSAGSVENVGILRNGEANMGFVQNNVVRDAVNGMGTFEGQPPADLEILMPLFTNVDHIVVRDAAGIDSLADIGGSRWAVGRPGSGTIQSNTALLNAADLGMDDINAEQIGQGEALDALTNGIIDGADVVSGVPYVQLREALTTAGDDIGLLSLSDKEQSSVVETSGWKKAYTIPAGTYAGQDSEVQTVAHVALIMVPADFPDALGYELVRTLYDNADQLRAAHNAFANFTPEAGSALMRQFELPTNDGAARAFSEYQG